MSSTVLPSPEGTAAIAASLARFGWRVFPVEIAELVTDDGQVKRTKTPKVPSFPTDATDDPGVIFEWWSKRPEMWIGIHVGGSGIVALDVDLEHACERTQGEIVSGRSSLKTAGLKPPKTVSYKTLGGGKHYLYQAPEGVQVTNAQDLLYDGTRLEGVDVRGGHGFLVYYGPKLDEAAPLAPAPDWVVVEKAYTASHDLRLDAWLDALVPGKPTLKAKKALERFSSKGMSHDDLLAATKAIAELGAAGRPGVRKIIDKARAIYSDGWAGYEAHFDAALLGSANFWGMPVDWLDETKGKAKTKTKGKKAKKAPKGGELVRVEASVDVLPAGIPEVEIRKRPRIHPDDFFDKTGILSAYLAEAVNLGDLAIGADKLVWRYVDGVWQSDDDEVMRRTVKALKNRYRREHTPLARDLIAADPKTPRLTNDPIGEYMNLTNGMYHWRSGQLLGHAPGFFSTVRLPFAFEPDADCPNFEAWLDEVASPEVQVTIWELIAYSMMSGNPFQKAAILVGPGGTGKGTLIRILERMAGSENLSALDPAQMAGTFESAQMLGKLLNVNGDLEGRFLPDSAAFKKVTGGDRIEAQNKNKPLFRYRPWCFPVFATNTIAKSGDVTSGYFRRWLVVPFTHTVDRGIPFDESAIHREAPGIFRKAMEHLPTIIDQNGFTPTPTLMQALKEFEDESDSIREWLGDDERIVSADPSDRDSKTNRAFLYGRYVDWAKDTGHGRPLSRTKLVKRLTDLGFETVMVNGHPHLRGVKLDVAPAPEAQGRPTPFGTARGFPADPLDP